MPMNILPTAVGYISLNQKLNDQQLLAVSYSYTLNGSNQVYKVGNFQKKALF
jgi:cell surface protein SprA